MIYSDKQIQDLLDGIYNGSITEYDLPDDLYEAIGDYLQKGLFKGFGESLETASGKDFELLAELHDNIWMFGAAKTYQEVLDIRSLLFDENGNLRSSSDFNKLGRESFSNWNDNYGRTEYNTAIGQAQMASKWNDIQKDKDILPTLVFDTNGVACPECAPYEGYAAPVDDPVWDFLMPLLHFNCQCTVRQEDKDFPLSKEKIDPEKIDPLFRMNPGKDKVIFSDEHPYFQVAKKDVDFAKENFGLPIPEIPRFTNVSFIDDANLTDAEKNNFLQGIGLPNEFKGKAYFKKYDDYISVKAQGQGMTMYRSFYKDYVQNNYIKISDSSPYKGKGAFIFKDQVDSLTKQGYKKIQTVSDGFGQSIKANNPNGYYTWPRLGYKTNDDMSDFIKKFNFENNTDVKNFEELIGIKTGQEYWKKFGFPQNLEFSLKDDSYSQKILKNYINERGAKGTK